MNIIVNPKEKTLKDYYDKNIFSYILPLENYAVDYEIYYSLDEIKKIKEEYLDCKLFIVINKNIFNDELDNVKEILFELEKINVEALLFYDLAILQLVKENKIDLNLCWNQTHMVTNYKTCNYYFSKGVKYALLSSEITKEEILDIKDKSEIIPLVKLVYYPVVAHSKRKLITNFYKSISKSSNNNISVLEKVSKQNYFLQEDNNGTSFILKDLVNGTVILKELLENDFPFIIIDEVVEHDLFLSVLDKINYYISNYKNISSAEEENLFLEIENIFGNNTGFFFKKTIYKVKKDG